MEWNDCCQHAISICVERCVCESHGAALDLILKATDKTVSFELAGEIHLKLALEVSLLWWSHDYSVPIPQGPGINQPGVIYEHSWANPF